MEARVGIEFEDKNFLFIINKKLSLQDNIEAICKRNSLMTCQSYGLKFNYSRNGINSDYYVTEENFNEIQDGFTLKLVASLDVVIDNIFHNLIHDRQQTFNDLHALSTDPGFIKALVNKGRDKDILLWLTDKHLSGKELSACLLVLLHLLKKQQIKNIPNVIIKNIINCIKPSSAPEQLQLAMAVLCQILYLKGYEMNKEMIILQMSFKDLILFIRNQEHPQLQLNTIMLINAIVKSVKGDKQIQFIRELDRFKNKEYIFKYIIRQDSIENAMAHELYVYQTHILSLYADKLNSYVDLTNNTFIKELEFSGDDMSYLSTFVDFESISRSRSSSIGTILEDMDDTRISFASNESEKDSSNELLNYTSTLWDNQISYLTYECLLHYKKCHYKNFCQSRIEENTYTPGIYLSSERITRLLANLLHIGIKPSRSGMSYHPLVFNGSLKLPLFLELFSRTMWLLSKTRREMKASTFDDYSKVLLVLEKQIKMVLEQKPKDYDSLTKNMIKTTYRAVESQWQKEKENEWKILYDKNPSVQILKQKFRAENENLIFEQRIKTLQKGDSFPKLSEKRGKQQYFFLRLSDNKRTVIWDDWDETLEEFKSNEPHRFDITDIKYFVTGKACLQVKDNSIKYPDRAFSIILEDDTTINFQAKDMKTAKLWIDGFSLLLEKPYRSITYHQELETLIEMDCALHLLELQNIPLSNTPPIIPPLPKHMRNKPPIPPKSPNIMTRRKLSSLNTTIETA